MNEDVINMELGMELMPVDIRLKLQPRLDKIRLFNSDYTYNRVKEWKCPKCKREFKSANIGVVKYNHKRRCKL